MLDDLNERRVRRCPKFDAQGLPAPTDATHAGTVEGSQLRQGCCPTLLYPIGFLTFKYYRLAHPGSGQFTDVSAFVA